MAKPGSSRGSCVTAIIHFEKDISFLFPYINAVADEAELHENPNLVRFVFDKVYCVVYPERCIASPLDDREHATAFREKLMEFLNGILDKKNDIIPKFKVFQKIAVTDILKLLPKTNCGKCGLKSCMAFAAMVSKQRVQPSKCPYVGLPINEQVTYPVRDNDGNLVSSVTLNIDTSNQSNKIHETNKIHEKNVPMPALNRKDHPANLSLPSALTQRELEVLSGIGLGQTNREISQQLHISPHTVKSHVVNIFNKLGVSHRTQAVVWAARHQII
ncbi:LuxR C-terminal-related transcriptional regulator [Desulfobacula toluolica]|nr:LuxR C-terminal-related transcriptional regulator [Desulfobacula toluolica]